MKAVQRNDNDGGQTHRKHQRRGCSCWHRGRQLGGVCHVRMGPTRHVVHGATDTVCDVGVRFIEGGARGRDLSKLAVVQHELGVGQVVAAHDVVGDVPLVSQHKAGTLKTA